MLKKFVGNQIEYKDNKDKYLLSVNGVFPFRIIIW